MSLEALRRRLNRFEAKRNPAGHRGAIRIITENDADAQAQIAELTATGQCGPGILIIDRRIVDQSPRNPQ